MRTLIISIMILVAASIASANDISLNIEKFALLTPSENDMDTKSSQIAVFFDIPDSLDGKYIVYAELVTEFNLSDIYTEDIRIIELQAFGITNDWTEADNWNSLAGKIDSLSFYSCPIKLDQNSSIFMDVTQYVKDITDKGNANFGLMLIPQKFEPSGLHLSNDAVNQIQRNTRLKIIFN